MKVFTGKLFKRVNLLALSLILATSGMSAAMPLFLSQKASAAPPSTVYVDRGYTSTGSDGGHAWGSTAFNSIQSAITAASPGDIISIADGTYNEGIRVTKPLTIEGAGADQTFLIGNIMYTVSIEASDVTIEGLNISSPNYNGGGDASGIVVSNAGRQSNLHITNVTIHDIGTANRSAVGNLGSQGINVGPVNGLEIDHSTIYNIANDNGDAYGITMWGNSSSDSANDINIHNNNIYGITNPDWAVGISMATDSANVTVDNNTTTGPFSTAGVYTSYGMAGPATITNNTVTGASTNGMLLMNPLLQTVTGNSVSGAVTGIQVDSANAADLVINRNSISGNTTGLSNSSASTVNAISNWWGDASGPGSVGPGTGDVVSNNVNYKPWCTNSDCTNVSSPNAITVLATGVTLADATLNGTNGSYAATGHSLWVSTTSFSTNSPSMPSGVYSTPVLGPVVANGNFSALLSSLTTHDGAVITGGVRATMPAMTSNTTYYYAAWSEVDGVWYPGQVLSFTTERLTPPTNLTLKTLPGNITITNGYTNSYGVTASWSPVDGATHYMYKYWNNISGSYYSTHPYIVSTATTTRSGIFNQGEGVHYIAVSACDVANNCSDYSSPFAVTYDKTAPVVNNLVLTKTPANGTSVSLTGTISDANLKDYHYQIVSSAKQNVLGEYSWSKVGGTSNVTNGLLLTANISTLRLDGTHVAPLPDGNYYLRVWADDLAGNRAGISTLQYYLPFTIDRTGPTVTIADITTPITSGNITPTVTASDTSEPLTYKWTAASANPAAIIFNDSIAEPTFTPSVAGTYSFTLVTTDAVGNSTPKTFGFTYTPAAVNNSGTITTPSAIVVTSQPTNNKLGAQAVLGAQTTAPAGDTTTTQTPATNALGAPAVKGASDQLATTPPPSSSTGLAWYWWVLIIAAIVSFIWWLIARMRNKTDEV